MIANCGMSETGGVEGRPGDQTGQEYCVRTWYSRPWTCVLYYPETRVSNEIARQSENAANNRHIGYGQLAAGNANRIGMFNNLADSNWQTNQITIDCNADCSSSTAACIIAAGHACNVQALMRVQPWLTTYNMRRALMAAGFKLLTDKKYLTSDAYLGRGWILLNDSCHVAVNLTNGRYYGGQAPAKTTTKTLAQVAAEVIQGDWGNGDNRAKRLKASGYDPASVQEMVNELLTGKHQTSAKKTLDQLAREVLAGQWGNDPQRSQKLKAAGYDAAAVQKRVNELV